MDPNAMPTDPGDPNPPEPQPEPVPEPTPYRPSREELFQALSQDLGWSPDEVAGAIFAKSSYDRHQQELDRKERELAAKEAQIRAMQPPPDYSDPRYIAEEVRGLRQIVLEDREERRRAFEEERHNAMIGSQLRDSYEMLMERTPTHNRVDAQRFFGAMEQLYPGGVPDGLSVQRAVENTAGYLGLRNGYGGGAAGMAARSPIVNGRGPTATVLMPGTTVSANQNPADDGGPQRPNETLEEYVMRRRKWREENNVVANIRDGVRYSSD